MKSAIYVYKWLGPFAEKKGFYVYVPGFKFVFPLKRDKKGIWLFLSGMGTRRYEVKEPLLVIDVELLGLEPYVSFEQADCDSTCGYCLVREGWKQVDLVLKDTRYPATLFARASMVTIHAGIFYSTTRIFAVDLLEPGEYSDFPLRPWIKLYNILVDYVEHIKPESLERFLGLFASLRGCTYYRDDVRETLRCMKAPKPSVANYAYIDLFKDYYVLYKLASLT